MQYISRSHFSVVLRLAMFFFFALPLCIQAESNVIVANEGEPTATIHDSVNAITGDFFVSQEDMVVQGAEPIRIRRGYISGSKQGLLGGWSFFLSYLKLEFQPFVGRITAMDSSGTVLVFQGRSFNTSKKEKDIEHYTLVMNEGAQSLTNTARGGISGRSNLKNTRAELSEKGTVIKIILPDGGVRTYRKLSGSKNALKVFRFNLESEKLPNGNKIFYTYDGGNQLKRIHTTNPQETKTYAWLNLNFESKKKEKFEYVNIQTSDGKTLKYKLEPRNYKKEDIQLIDTVYSPEYPEELIQYNEPLDGKGPLLVRRLFPEGRAVQAEYYHSKHNNQAGKDVFIPDSSDPRCGRVSILLTPVAYDHNPYPICYFFYHPGEYGKTGGSTEVIDAHSNKIVYHYSPHLRLTTLSRFCNSLSGEYLYNTEKLAWGAENSQDVSNLLCRSLVDPEEKGLFARRFFYDNRGNITEEKLYGNLTGANSNPLLINKDHLPEENGIESSSKLYFYTEDNLLSKEEEENGLASTYYSYIYGTDRLTGKFVCEQGKIKIRHLFEYNQDLILIKEIIDDGSTLGASDLTDVTQRKIKVYTPKQLDPFLGMPEIVEEKYLDLNTQQEILLKKTVFGYGWGGRIETQAVYDATNTFRYATYTKYDSFGRPLEQSNAMAQVAKSKYDANGNRIFYEDYSCKFHEMMHYDFSNRLIFTEKITSNGLKRTTSATYNLKNCKKTDTDTFGNVTEYSYDQYDNLIATYSPICLNEHAESFQPIIQNTYDAAGRKISEIDARGHTLKTLYNARNKPIQIFYADGSTESLIYNLDGTLNYTIDQLGTKIHYTHDFLGRTIHKKTLSSSQEILSEEHFVYDSFNLISSIDPEGNTTYYYYDGAGRKSAEEFHTPQGIERTEFSYDALGRLYSVKQNSGSSTLIQITERDLLDRIIEERSEDQEGNILLKVNYEYDAGGNIEWIIREQGGKITKQGFLYDGFGRLTEKLDALGHITRIEYNEEFRNTLGQCVLQKTHTDALGIRTIETFDSRGFLVSSEKKNTFNQTISLEEKFYDPEGHLCRQLSTVYKGTTPSREVETIWEYGFEDHLIKLIEAKGTKDQKITRFTYKAKGLLHQIYKPDGTVLNHDHDLFGRLSTLYSSNGKIGYDYHYNRLHQLISTQDLNSGNSTLRSYTPRGALLEETLAHGITLQNTYDLRGRRKKQILPDGSSIHYHYDALYLREVSRHAASGLSLYSHQYLAFDTSGNLLEEALIGNLGHVYYGVDPLGRTDCQDSPYFSQQINQYDPVGNIRQTTINQHLIRYTYDSLNQLIEEEGFFTHRNTYDSHNNLLEKDGELHDINILNQLLRANNTDYSYDADGNLRCKRTANEEVLYDYDALDRLIEVTHLGQYRLVFTYDSLHRRLTKTTYSWSKNKWEENQHLRFIYDDQNEIGAIDSTNSIIQLRILGAAPQAEIASAIAFEFKEDIYAPLYDLYGNVSALVSLETQTIAETYRYSAFGEEALFDASGQSIESSQNPWRFSSKRIDSETHLVYFGRRYYDPSLGRWLTPDPKSFQDGPNLYAFLHNNSLIHVDLYGLHTSLRGAEADKMMQICRNINLGQQATSDKPLNQALGIIGKAISRLFGEVINRFFFHFVPIPGARGMGFTIGTKLGGTSMPNEHSSESSVGTGYLSNKIRICFVNGILNDSYDAEDSSRMISQNLNNSRVSYLHNATHGIVLDLFECAVNAFGYQTSPSKKLAKMLKNLIHEVGGPDGGGMVAVFAHSQGGLILRQALTLMSREERKLLQIYTFGSAAIFAQGDARSVQHIASTHDVIPLLSLGINYIKNGFSMPDNFIRVKSGSTFLQHQFKSYQEDLNPICLELLDKCGER